MGLWQKFEYIYGLGQPCTNTLRHRFTLYYQYGVLHITSFHFPLYHFLGDRGGDGFTYSLRSLSGLFGALSLGDFCLYSARNFSLRVQLGWRRLSLHINGGAEFLAI